METRENCRVISIKERICLHIFVHLLDTPWEENLFYGITDLHLLGCAGLARTVLPDLR